MSKKLDLYAYSFQSGLTFETMLARLIEEWSVRWSVRENDNWDEYLATMERG